MDLKAPKPPRSKKTGKRPFPHHLIPTRRRTALGSLQVSAPKKLLAGPTCVFKTALLRTEIIWRTGFKRKRNWQLKASKLEDTEAAWTKHVEAHQPIDPI